MSATDFDMIVVGAGIIGTCTAYHAQKAGLKTLLVEQFSLGHGNGSSAGKSRIIRYAHTEPQYLPLVHEAYKQIAEMEKKRGEKLWIKTGLLWMGKSHEIDDVARILNDFKCENEVLSAAEVSRRYPQFSYGNEYKGLVDPMGGVILADKWISTYQDEFLKAGGTVYDNTIVKSYEDGDIVRLQTSKGPITSNKAVFAVGTWVNKLIPNLPIKCDNQHITVAYWSPKDKKDTHLTMTDKYPCVVVNTEGIGYYSLPSVDYPGVVKYAYHEGERYEVGNDLVNPSMKYVDRTREHLKAHVPFLEAERGPWRVDKCKYAMSPDENYIIDRVPGSKNILVCGYMSGTGFKNGPSIGLALTQISKGEKPCVDLTPFGLHRFAKKSKL